MILYQISYQAKNANPDSQQNIRRPYALKVTRNNNLVFSIQTIKEMNQIFQPLIEISKRDKIDILIDGYDGTAEIYIFGLVAERLGVNMNG